MLSTSCSWPWHVTNSARLPVRADFDRAVLRRRDHPDLSAPYPTELDAFQAEAQALLGGRASSFLPTCSPASPRASRDRSGGRSRKVGLTPG